MQGLSAEELLGPWPMRVPIPTCWALRGEAQSFENVIVGRRGHGAKCTLSNAASVRRSGVGVIAHVMDMTARNQSHARVHARQAKQARL